MAALTLTLPLTLTLTLPLTRIGGATNLATVPVLFGLSKDIDPSFGYPPGVLRRFYLDLRLT